MSFQLMAWAMKQRTGSGPRKAVLLALADHANAETGECFPGIPRLARQTEFGETTVKTALRDLVKSGLIERERRRNQDGSLGSYSYTFPTAAVEWVEGREPPVQGRLPPLGPGASPAPEPGEDLEPGEMPPSETSLGADAVSRIYECWREERGRTRSNYRAISPARRKKIEARLKEFTEAELIQAIRSVAADPWPERRLHDDLTVIFRSREQVERFLEMGEGSPLEQFHDHAAQAVADARRRRDG